MLTETLQNGEFSNVVVNNTFAGQEMTGQERAFVSRLYLGTLERLIYLDHIINKLSKTPTQKMKPVVVNILRLSTYQLIFMSSVPDFAAINEAGKLARKRGFGSLASFINGVLRSIQRNIGSLEDGMPENVRLSVPKWMYDMIIADCGREAGLKFLKGALSAQRGVTIRLNLKKGSPGELLEELANEGCQTFKISDDLECYKLGRFKSLTELESYKKGLFIVQDLSSVRAAMAGCLKLKEECGNSEGEGLLIVDVCAAPGGKSLCAAEMFPKARIISRDLTEYKIKMIEQNIERLGISNVEPEVFDALVFDERLKEKADLVIADLPCSGLGVIGGKPDIKFRVRQKDLAELAGMQRNILDVVQEYVREGGFLVYSTCTVNKGENDDNVDYFTSKYGFELICRRHLLPEDGDGFFVAVLKKKNS